MGVNKGGIEDYFNYNRNTCSIVLPDRDIAVFYNEYFKTDSQPANLQLEDIDGNSQSMVSSVELKGRNALLFGRINNTSIVGKNSSTAPDISYATVVPYANNGELFPLINVFDYNVTFDKTSNLFTIVFWCNMKDEYSGTTYDYSQVWEEFKNLGTAQSGIWDWDVDKTSGLSTTNLAKRQMFVATGSMKKYFVTNGHYSGTANSSWNSIPIFNVPKKIDLKNEYDFMPSYPVYPKVYQVVSSTSGGVAIKPIKSDGTLVDVIINVKTISSSQG